METSAYWLDRAENARRHLAAPNMESPMVAKLAAAQDAATTARFALQGALGNAPALEALLILPMLTQASDLWASINAMRGAIGK